jgi:hypothetical protein
MNSFTTDRSSISSENCTNVDFYKYSVFSQAVFNFSVKDMVYHRLLDTTSLLDSNKAPEDEESSSIG